MGIDRLARAVFLDRDGTINRAVVRNGKPYAPDTVDQLELLPGAEPAVVSLKAAGYLVIVVTNQPDVGAGCQRREVVEAMHAKLRHLLPIDEVRVCYHVDDDGCDCRKPAPGMILGAATSWRINLTASYMIGDRWRDIEAGRAAGCRTILIRNEYDERQSDPSDATVDSLGAAAQFILTNSNSPGTHTSRS
jgi:D-glycero-D-manno-heptose 1,7-bisphosphate phosphatase